MHGPEMSIFMSDLCDISTGISYDVISVATPRQNSTSLNAVPFRDCNYLLPLPHPYSPLYFEVYNFGC